MKRTAFITAIATAGALAVLAAAPAQAREMTDMKYAVLRSIDKVSARTMTFEVPVGKTVQFGQSLYIKARACRKTPPTAEPESASFLQIWEKDVKTDQSQWVFSGWMFASSPGVSAMEHPVYDVWVIDCKNDLIAARDTQEFSSETVPAESGDFGRAAAPKPDTPAAPAPEGVRAEAPVEAETPADAAAGAGASTAAPDAVPEGASFEDEASNGENETGY